MCVRFAFHKASPRHYCIGIIPAAVAVLHSVFHQGEQILLHGLGELGLVQGYTPGTGERHARLGFAQMLEREKPTSLGENLALQSPAILLGRQQVCLRILLELIHPLLIGLGNGLYGELNLRIQRTHVHVLRVAHPAPPHGEGSAKLRLIQELNGLGHIRHFKSAGPKLGKTLQQHSRNHGR